MYRKIEDRRQLEICCFDLESVALAAHYGVPRIELCIHYREGGLWPGGKLIQEARAIFPGILSVMIRPRPGEFHYTRKEWDIMSNQAREALALGADGLTFGAMDDRKLLPDRDISDFLRLFEEGVITFHRAFDELSNTGRSLEMLRNLGVHRILTSGGGARAVEHALQLGSMQRRLGEALDVVAAGSVRAPDIPILKAAGVRAFHSAASDTEDGRVNPLLLEALVEALHETTP